MSLSTVCAMLIPSATAAWTFSKEPGTAFIWFTLSCNIGDKSWASGLLRLKLLAEQGFLCWQRPSDRRKEHDSSQLTSPVLGKMELIITKCLCNAKRPRHGGHLRCMPEVRKVKGNYICQLFDIHCPDCCRVNLEWCIHIHPQAASDFQHATLQIRGKGQLIYIYINVRKWMWDICSRGPVDKALVS